MITFLRRNINFEISSFRAIYFSDFVFNLTMPKWLDITNFISSNKNKNTKKLTDISFLQACLSADFQHKLR